MLNLEPPILAIFLALLTIAAVITKPKGLDEGVAGIAGALLFLITGIVSPRSAGSALLREWNVFLFFLGLMVVIGVAEQIGTFDWVASSAARLTGGSVRSLWLMTCGVVIGVTILLTNDTSALVLTPIVYTLTLRARVDPLPFLFATTFLANAASLLLPISNPLNFLVTDSFGISLATYSARMVLPEIAAVSVTLLALFVFFRRDLHGQTVLSEEPHPPSAAIRQSLCLIGLLILCDLLVSPFGVPLGPIAVGGGVIMFLAGVSQGEVGLSRLSRSMSWQVFGFFAGMIVAIRGLQVTGVLPHVAAVVAHLSGHGQASAVVVTSLAGAVGSNIVNNLPTALALTAALHQHTTMPPTARTGAIYGIVLGSDLGPNLSYLGSLSSMLWLLLLRRRGLDISATTYLRLGVIVTPTALTAGVLALILSLR